MDCRSFRKHHLAYLDNTLPGELLVAAECHVIECEVCARHDTAVRRSLLLARNLAPIEPSADFAARLEARLRAELAASAERGESRGHGDATDLDIGTLDRTALIHRALGSRTRAAALAAGLLLLAGGAALDWSEPAELRHPPVLATRPQPEPTPPFVAAELVTSASTGVSVWPAALLADQIPAQLMGAQFQTVSYGY